MDYKNATALDILDGIEKQFLIGEENKPIVKRDKQGRFMGTLRGGKRLGFRWGKGFYVKSVEMENDSVTYAQVCLIGSVQALIGELELAGHTDSVNHNAGQQALTLLHDTIVEETGYSGIIAFNDADKTTFNDVLKVIRKAKERFWKTK